MNIINQEILTNWRRDLHQIPEISLKEYKTKEYIVNVLKQHNIEYKEVLDTGIIVELLGKNKNKQDKTILFRADIDALPIQESNDISFKSKHNGVMHACGHDGHTTVLLGTLIELNEYYKNNEVNINTIFVFQPAEETIGGGKLIIASDEYDFSKFNIIGSYAIHLNPDYLEHHIISKPGYIMASANELFISIKGEASHAGLKHKGKDALNAATILYQELMKINSINLNTRDLNIIHIGKIYGGDAPNIVAKEAYLEGTIRTLKKENYKEIMAQISKVKNAVEIITGTEIIIEEHTSYDSVNNDLELYNIIKEVVNKENIDYIELPESYLFGEDFSAFSEISKINYSFLGIRSEEKGYTSGLHTPTFNFDEQILMTGVRYFLGIFNYFK
ncbi:M20 metallopeptidase family protein [Gemelliphila palaticanis]|uniref:Amidohydrolase n=1 Tax=Gemelliphila palaticanis TaxID=81950 RepID=A0ABX2SYJ5_9BACL|nr:M20 family metallopeptidase [Gemella palaticanis]MBF0715472.1 amidohydrolase [Gemella palaticanis]NYS47402.1 amidohydrolase [Gemella palaticanis]